MRAPSHYRARAERWREWLDANPTAKPGHRATAAKLAAAYESVLPEAEAAFERLKGIGPRPAVTCEAEGCSNTFPDRANKAACSAACRQAVRRQKATRPAQIRWRGRAGPHPLPTEGMSKSVTLSDATAPRSRDAA